MPVLQVFEHERIRVGQARKGTDGEPVRLSDQAHKALAQFSEAEGGHRIVVGRDSVRFTQHVGVIQVGELCIEILPKAADRRGGEQSAKAWRDVLLMMLRLAAGLRIQTQAPTGLQLRQRGLLELFAASYLERYGRILRGGLVRGYRIVEHDLRQLRGRLLCSKNIARNALHPERFYVQSQEFDFETLPNQVLLKALEVVARLPVSRRLQLQAHAYRDAFPEIEVGRLDASTLASMKLPRSAAHYGPAIEIAKPLILAQGPELSFGQAPVVALLFDMNRLFEVFVARLARHALPGWKVEAQSTKAFWKTAGMTRILRPDLVLRSPCGSRRVVVDTKWKLPQHGSPAMGDLRQMYAYCRHWEAERGVLLYPAAGRRRVKGQRGSFVESRQGCETAFLPLMRDGVVSREVVVEGLGGVVGD